jgi:putative colanic acid biosynthesis acetyltransferase WcaF
MTDPPRFPASDDPPAIRVRNDLPSVYAFRNKAGRALWGLVWALFFRPSPRPLHGWRRFLLRCFGARLADTARIAPSANVWGPWNLRMDHSAEIGPNVDCYCVAPIHLGAHATVSQYAYLCAGSRDVTDPRFAPTKTPIVIEDQAWVCAGAFIGAGVRVGQGAVVSARAVAISDIPSWTLCAGNPAQPVRKRTIRGTDETTDESR